MKKSSPAPISPGHLSAIITPSRCQLWQYHVVLRAGELRTMQGYSNAWVDTTRRLVLLYMTATATFVCGVENDAPSGAEHVPPNAAPPYFRRTSGQGCQGARLSRGHKTQGLSHIV